MNEYLLDFKGKTISERLQADALRYLREGKQGYLHEQSVVMVTSRDEIVGIGGSCKDDMFVDNFGILLAGLIRAPFVGITTVNITDIGGTSRAVSTYSSAGGVFNVGAEALGTNIQVGSSVVAPTRADYKVGTAFTMAPENAIFPTSTGSYSVGTGNTTFSGAITTNAGEAGTVNEGCFFGYWQYAGGAFTSFMIAHDAISPGVAFLGGQSITVGWSITD